MWGAPGDGTGGVGGEVEEEAARYGMWAAAMDDIMFWLDFTGDKPPRIKNTRQQYI
jgi:hypothetical protein